MPRPMLAAVLALALGFAALPLFSVFWFHDEGPAAEATEARALTTPTAADLAGQAVEPVAFGLSEKHCSFADDTGPAT